MGQNMRDNSGCRGLRKAVEPPVRGNCERQPQLEVQVLRVTQGSLQICEGHKVTRKRGDGPRLRAVAAGHS